MKATSNAIEELKKVLKTEENPLAGIRIFSGQGCCGPSLQMSVSEKIPTGDELLTIDEVNFFIANEAREMLNGVTLDHGPNGFKLDGMKKNGGGCC
jgi:Fe-S cluster assembly iron-binding protein IscA